MEQKPGFKRSHYCYKSKHPEKVCLLWWVNIHSILSQDFMCHFRGHLVSCDYMLQEHLAWSTAKICSNTAVSLNSNSLKQSTSVNINKWQRQKDWSAFHYKVASGNWGIVKPICVEMELKKTNTPTVYTALRVVNACRALTVESTMIFAINKSVAQ